MSLLSENTRRWKIAKARQDRVPAARAAARRFVAPEAKQRYQNISFLIQERHGKHIPWWFIPLVHERECVGGNTNWHCSIAQGDAFNKVSIHRPTGIGPFASFENAAVYSLVHAAPHAANNTNWSGGGVMTIGEKYNGLGYANKGRPSPYIWAGTDQYVKGKYVKDGVYDPNKVDAQLGMAITLKEMMKLDPSIVLDGDHPGQASESRASETTVVTTGTAGGMEAAHQFSVLGYDWVVVSLVAGIFIITASVIAYKIYMRKKSQ